MLMTLLLTATVAAPPPDPHWTERTDAELGALLTDACTASVTDGQPVLLEFSAPWCQDCVMLHRMSTEPALKAELDQWHHITAHVGRYDRHIDLLKAFSGDRIAWWVALKPTDCSAAPATWPVLKKGGIEPTADKAIQTPEAVVQWLKTARGG